MESGCRRASREYSTRAGKFSRFENGSWSDSLTLFRSMISYPNYKFIFPIKALGMFARRFGDPKVAYWASSKAEEVNDTLDIQV